MIALLLVAASARADDDEMPNAVPTVMYKRWAAAISYGASTLEARTDGSERHILAFFEMALRYRVIAELELGASFGGSLSWSFGVVTFQADARYRLYAERPWNPFVFGSVGIAKWDARDSAHLMLRAGTGLERRFEQWAFSLGIELCRVSEDSSAPERYLERHYGAWNASLAMSAIYYWGSGGRPLNRLAGRER